MHNFLKFLYSKIEKKKKINGQQYDNNLLRNFKHNILYNSLVFYKIHYQDN